jgi:hypothetical protein
MEFQKCSNNTVKLGNEELFGRPSNCSLMPKVPYPYEVNGKLVMGNGSLIPICSLLNSSLLASLTGQTIQPQVTETKFCI